MLLFRFSVADETVCVTHLLFDPQEAVQWCGWTGGRPLDCGTVGLGLWTDRWWSVLSLKLVDDYEIDKRSVVR